MTGLLRTNDYETVAQCLSFISVLAENANLIESQSKYFIKGQNKFQTEQPKNIALKDLLNKRLLILVMKTVMKSPEVEFLHFTTQILNIAIPHKELRNVILSEVLKTDDQLLPGEEVEQGKHYNYACFLKYHVEKLPEVVSIRKLH